MQNQFELTVKGDNFAAVVKQMRELVDAADKIHAAPTKRAAKPPVDVPDETLLDQVAEAVETDEPGETLESFDDAPADIVDEAPAKPAKVAAGKKVSKNDVDAAAMAHAKKHGRPATMKVLAATFKAKSILEIPEKNWPAAIKALKV